MVAGTLVYTPFPFRSRAPASGCLRAARTLTILLGEAREHPANGVALIDFQGHTGGNFAAAMSRASAIDFFIILVHHPVGVEEWDDVVHGIEGDLVPLVWAVVVEGEDFLVHQVVETELVVAVAVFVVE